MGGLGACRRKEAEINKIGAKGRMMINLTKIGDEGGALTGLEITMGHKVKMGWRVVVKGRTNLRQI